jgi:hypothetical protein
MSELTSFVFKDTGVTVPIRKVSPYLVMDLQRAFPPPEPPLNEVDYGDGKKVMEPNEASPAYQRELVKYNTALQERLQILLIKRGVAIELSDAQKAEVVELREFMKNELQIDLDPDDKVVYITRIAMGTDGDLTDLINAIMRRSQPTEEAVSEATKSIRR